MFEILQLKLEIEKVKEELSKMTKTFNSYPSKENKNKTKTKSKGSRSYL